MTKTDPRRADSDNDGLRDRYEIRRSKSDPRSADTDGDGLTDRYEWRRSRTNVRVKDTDADELTDRQELFPVSYLMSAQLLAGMFTVRTPRTDPRRRDTDGDGLSDGFEVRRSFTSPTLRDTERDRLDDGREVLVTRTNPLRGDTDGDGIGDWQEVQSGTDPLDPASGPAVPPPPPPTPPADTTPPDTTITSGPSGTITTDNASFTFTATEAGSTFQCRLDNGAWNTCTTPKTYTNLTNAQHTFDVRATDPAANTDPTPATRTWTTNVPPPPPPPDTTPPDTTITGGPSGTITTDNASFTFTATEAGSTFQCRLDNGAWNTCTTPKTYTNLTNAQHTFDVRATDPAANTDPTPATRTWTTNVPPPPPPPTGCTTSVSSVSAAQQAVAGAAPGAVVCLADGSYGRVTLNASKTAPGVTLRAQNPGQATIAGASMSGSHLTLARFRIAGDEVTVQPGSDHMTVDHNLITGGYFGVNAGPTTSTNVSDVAITGNRFVGPFGEDAIRINRYHDGPDADPYGILVEGNEITGVRENGNHSDCLQSVWGGDHLYFRRNYLHNNRCQGFFVKDQPATVDTVVAEDNLMLSNGEPCDPPGSGCGQPSVFQLFGPMTNLVMSRNTIWTPEGGSPTTLRDSGWGRVDMNDNVIYRLWSDTSSPFGNYGAVNNLVCSREGSWSSAGLATSCSPGFPNAAGGDYRIAGRGVTWAVADQQFGP